MRVLGLFTFSLIIFAAMLPGYLYSQNTPSRGRLLPVEENGKWGYIDLKGKVVIPFKFGAVGDFSEGIAPAKNDKRLANGNLRFEMGRWGYIDQKGNWIIPPTFDYCFSFSEGLGEVRVGGKLGYVDRTGKIVIEPQFFHTEAFSEGLAKVIRDQNSSKEFIDKTGKTIFKIEKIEGMGISVGNFRDGYATLFYWNLNDRQRDKYGYVDKNSVITILPYRGTSDFHNGLASVFNGGKNGFIDTNFELVIPVKYDDAKAFSEGLIAVQIGDKYGYMDRNEDIVIPAKFEDAEPFKEGLAAVADEDGKWGFINRKGNLIIDYKFEEVSSFNDGIAEVRTGDDISLLYGYIDVKGNFIWRNKKYLKK